MSNPIAPTVVEKLVTTDTTASSLVVGGASPVATTGTGGINAGAIVGTSVSDSVGTLATVRAGGIGIASQAALDLITGASGTQLARTAAGTALQGPRINAAANAWEFANWPITLLFEASGTSTDAGATNVSTYPLASQLTIKDALVIFVRHRNTGATANVVPVIYNSTDGVDVSVLSTANNDYYTDTVFIGAQSTTLVGGTVLRFGAGTVVGTRSTFTTSYAGNVTIALRHGGVTAPDTWPWAWTIYRISGQ